MHSSPPSRWKRAFDVFGACAGAAALALLLAGCNACSSRRAPPLGEGPGAGATTQSVLETQSPACADCAARHGCLDPAQQGGTCELVDGRVPVLIGGKPVASAPLDPPPPNPGYTANCLRTLADTFASHCADSETLTPCLCGNDPNAAVGCVEGLTPPAGPLAPDYAASFGGDGGSRVINQNFTLQTYGAGQANALVQCLAAFACRCCFGDGTCG